MKPWIARLIWGTTLAVWLVLPVWAAAEGSIRIQLDLRGTPARNGAITLYQVGQLTQTGCQLHPAWGGGQIRQEDLYSANLAGLLAEMAEGEGYSLYLDADGCAEFTGLEDGVYLVLQSEPVDGFYPIEPFVVTIPGQGTRSIQANPKTRPIVLAQTPIPTTGEGPVLVLGYAGMAASGLGLILSVYLGKIRR